MSGRHNLMNALAAAAVATCFEITPAQIAEAVSNATPRGSREVLDFAAASELSTIHTIRIPIIDQYGAHNRRGRTESRRRM